MGRTVSDVSNKRMPPQTTVGTYHLCDGVTATATLHKMEKVDIISVKPDKQTAVKCPMM